MRELLEQLIDIVERHELSLDDFEETSVELARQALQEFASSELQTIEETQREQNNFNMLSEKKDGS